MVTPKSVTAPESVHRMDTNENKLTMFESSPRLNESVSEMKTRVSSAMRWSGLSVPMPVGSPIRPMR